MRRQFIYVLCSILFIVSKQQKQQEQWNDRLSKASLCFYPDIFSWHTANMESTRVLEFLTEVEEAAEDVLTNKQQVSH